MVYGLVALIKLQPYKIRILELSNLNRQILNQIRKSFPIKRRRNMMAQIKVTRKSYVRKDGTVVKGTTYYTKDKGKPGKTPDSEKFYHPKVEMHWHKGQSAEVRRANALKAHSGNKLATARALQALANVTTDVETANLAKADADFFFFKH
jgi:hypothetical protein